MSLTAFGFPDDDIEGEVDALAIVGRKGLDGARAANEFAVGEEVVVAGVAEEVCDRGPEGFGKTGSIVD